MAGEICVHADFEECVDGMPSCMWWDEGDLVACNGGCINWKDAKWSCLLFESFEYLELG